MDRRCRARLPIPASTVRPSSSVTTARRCEQTGPIGHRDPLVPPAESRIRVQTLSHGCCHSLDRGRAERGAENQRRRGMRATRDRTNPAILRPNMMSTPAAAATADASGMTVPGSTYMTDSPEPCRGEQCVTMGAQDQDPCSPSNRPATIITSPSGRSVEKFAWRKDYNCRFARTHRLAHFLGGGPWSRDAHAAQVEAPSPPPFGWVTGGGRRVPSIACRFRRIPGYWII